MMAMALSDYLVLNILEKHNGKNLTQVEIQQSLDVYLSVRTIQRCVSRLEMEGSIKVDRNMGSNSGSIYHVTK